MTEKATTKQLIEIINKLLEELNESRQRENLVYMASPYDTSYKSEVWR